MSTDFSDGQIYVQFTHTDNAAEDMRLQTQQIEKALAQYEEDMQKLISSWEGDDQEVYVKKQQKWHEAVEKMKSLLASHATLLNEIGENYRTNQRNLTQGWENVKIGR
ncbi:MULTISPECIES: WXG100 family type VII secretion target [Streptomyces]|uniref:ESAT-6-like protein n=1 Tax=Streptomyces lonegramiae TaxID=3075524 RepID=A0ABU2X6I3_9ACTN|nr:WXG100 family type VII secretion target [Streptomyces sp. DSM 41529]MDT0541437.1 WXG100 family type VII secretion target [Streptomyces sp. DSM 41529]